MRPRRPGQSYVEVLAIVATVGALAGLAVPRFGDMRRRALVAQAVAEARAVRTAAIAHHGERGRWASETPAGILPAELVPYLPAGYGFDRGSYRLDWEVWALPSGLPQQPGVDALVGVSMVTEDAELGRLFLEALGGGAARFSSGNHYTMIIAGS